MPEYDFVCDECRRPHSKVMRMNEEHKSSCPSCGGQAHWKPTYGAPFKFTFRDGYDVCTGEYHPNKKHYEETKRKKGLVKIE